MPRKKRKYQAISTINIEPECKKRREERTSLLTRKRKNMVDQDKDTTHKSQKKKMIMKELYRSVLNANLLVLYMLNQNAKKCKKRENHRLQGKGKT